ncbi:unnamed protein product, partial [Ectocarpus sp. 12 AP-2014]
LATSHVRCRRRDLSDSFMASHRTGGNLFFFIANAAYLPAEHSTRSRGPGNAQPSWESKSLSGLMKLNAVVRGVVVVIFLARAHQRYGFVLAEPAPCSSSSS